MNSVVLDASFIVKLFVTEQGSNLAQAILEGYEEQKYRLLAPGHAFAEVGAVFCRKFKSGSITSEQLSRAVNSMTKRIELVSLDALLAPATQLAIATGVSVYDALYVVLAEVSGAVFLTADVKLATALKATPYASLILGIDESGLIFYGEP
jgi:predicted nucleic acid-binding protein